RGKALVLIALARQQGKKELFLDIIKRKFKGSVRDFLIWFGGPFKDINIEAIDYVDSQIQNASYMGNAVETGSVASDINKTDENKITRGAYKTRTSLDNKGSVDLNSTPLSVNFNIYGFCPVCGESWEGEDMFKIFRKQDWTKNMTTKQLKEYIKKSYPKPYKFSKIIGIEIPEKYDGVSLWECPFC
ncbi:MAG: hypothetical protein PHS54_07525, partial [Clostridia bacterium]|nr:hypothetical protein [Clostridia bacterium]